MPAVMDFFEHQEMARKRTGRLVVLYVLAVVAIIVLIYAAVSLVFQWNTMQERGAEYDFWNPGLLATVGGGVLLIVLLSSLYKISELRAGGHVVAKSLGGRLINTGTRDDVERKVLNVVEEMAIASGTPVPSVYMLDRESRINAFAAGYRPEQAVIGVTRGCAELLTRDELQGVMAHEFSHILNGDMRLNVRLIGILHGILVIGLIGAYIVRASYYSGRSSRRDSGAGLVAVGFVMMVLGYIGTFFGGLIKAAVSRQREFLADASAVDFTRNPDGISGALQKIGGSTGHARLASPKAGEFSHMYFGQGIANFLNAMATHPPLPERIRRVDPRWNGRFPKVGPARPAEEPARERKLEKARRRQPVPEAALMGAIAAVGRPTAAHVDYAAQLVGGLPAELKEAVHTPDGARAVAYALLLDDAEAPRAVQLEHLRADGAHEATLAMEPHVAAAGIEARLPLLDLAIPALKEMSRGEYEAFKKGFAVLAGADERIDRFEWLVRRMILSYLEPHFDKATTPVVQYYNLAGVKKECTRLLATLAHEGNDASGDAAGAFQAGARRLGLGALTLLPADDCGLRALDDALDRLALVTPRLKKRVLEACAACIAADKQVTVGEGEFFRGIAAVLDCPMPPLLPGQPL